MLRASRSGRYSCRSSFICLFDYLRLKGGLMRAELNRRGLGAAMVADGKRASFWRVRALALLFERTISAPCTYMLDAYRCDRLRKNLKI